ncbi:MAG: glycosyltransferase family 2 protein [Acidobacteriota bacterium]
MTPRATVIIPTFDHGPQLRLAVESVRRQTETRLEIVIVGDGAPAATEAIGRDLEALDPRIRWVGFPKDARHGERHRDAVLRQAAGEIICYLADDDLWTPDHVETMWRLLGGAGADVATTLMVRVQPGGGLALGPARFVNLSSAHHRRLFAQPTSGFATGLSIVAHTRAFYDRLPFGWQTTPPGIPTDGWMWRQLLSAPGVRTVSECRATLLQFHGPPRRAWSVERRLAEMARWFDALADGRLNADFRRLEREACRPSSLAWAWQVLWMQLHRRPMTGRPAMRLAAAVLNRPWR